jgi:UDP-3-O-[3-hydroxymyristoyl] N-acetylglucosamine deacetylase
MMGRAFYRKGSPGEVERRGMWAFLAGDTRNLHNVAQIPQRIRSWQNVTYKLLILKHKLDICWPTTCYNKRGEMFQNTIARESSAEGVGLHTGVYGHIRLVPAPAETGIVFRRVDLDNFPIEAQGHNVARVSYATSLMKQGVLLSTTEHLLAAIYSCGIDNIYIDIDSIEVPILDGSAEPFMQMLEHSGVRKLRRKRRYLKVLKPLEVVEGDRRIGIYPAEELRVRCYVDFPHTLVGQQEVEMLVGPDTFRHLLARARTFCFERDIEPLKAMGLIRGGSLENAIVLTNDGVMNGPLRFPDEFGRHKALDLIGDLALAGLPLLARVEAHKAGHSLHTQLVSRLLADPSLWTITTGEAVRPESEAYLTALSPVPAAD